MTKISIIIPTVNSLWLEQILALALQQIDYFEQPEIIEVIVVGLDEAGVAKRKSGVKFIDTGQKIRPAAARNLGIQQAKGDILCFLDDDCLPAANWLVNLLAPYQQGQRVVGGSITFPTDDYWTVVDSLAHFANVLAETDFGERRHLPSLNFSLHRSVIEKVGLFDEDFPFPAGEDTEFTLRIRKAGFTLWFAADAVVHHSARRESAVGLWRRAWNFGQSVAVNPEMQSLLHPSSFFRHWFIVQLTAMPRAWLSAHKIFKEYPALSKYKQSFWGLLWAKIAWLLSVSVALRHMNREGINPVK